MGANRSFQEVYESGTRIPADEITEWQTDAAEYIPRLFRADPVQFAPMARFLRAALLIVEQLQADAASVRCTCPRDDPWQRDCPVHGEAGGSS